MALSPSLETADMAGNAPSHGAWMSLTIHITTMQSCYTNSTSLLFAAMSLYHLRIIERLWGSRKFAVSFLVGYHAMDLE